MDNSSPPIPPWELERQRKESDARKTANTPSPPSMASSPRSIALGSPSPSTSQPPRRDSVVRSLSFSPSPGAPSPPPSPLSQSSSPSLPFLKSPLIGGGAETGDVNDAEGDGDESSATNLDRHSVSGPGFSVTVVARSGFAADLSLSARLDVDPETAFATLVDPEPAPWRHSTVLRRRVISSGGGGGAGGAAAAAAAAEASASIGPSSSSSPPTFSSLSPRTVEVEQAAHWAFFRSVTTRLLVREVRWVFCSVFLFQEREVEADNKKLTL